jgi:hypothetical protein
MAFGRTETIGVRCSIQANVLKLSDQVQSITNK